MGAGSLVSLSKSAFTSALELADPSAIRWPSCVCGMGICSSVGSIYDSGPGLDPGGGLDRGRIPNLQKPCNRQFKSHAFYQNGMTVRRTVLRSRGPVRIA